VARGFALLPRFARRWEPVRFG